MANQDNRPAVKQDSASEINLLDIFFYLLRYWYLYVLSVGLIVAFSLYRNAKQPYVYESSVKIFIKDASQRAMMDADVLRFARTNRLNMDNEQMQLTSRRVIERTVKMANAHVFYKAQQGLRQIELYNESPFSMKFLDTLDRATSFVVRYGDAGHALVIPAGRKKAITVPLNVPVKIGEERFIIEPRDSYNSPWEHASIQVQRASFSQTVRYYQKAVTITQPVNRASTLTLDLQDQNKKRALDILLAQVAAYNQEELDMRNQVAKNTADFVNERLATLSQELGLVEGDMERFLISNRTIDFDSKVGRFNSRSAETETQALEIETQLKLVSYMLSQITSSGRQYGYLPLNIAAPDPALDGYISQYNQLKSQRDKLIEGAGGSTENPVISEYDRALDELRRSAVESLNQRAALLRARLKDTEGIQSSLLSKLP